jgi:hypothetical protein
MTGYAPCWWPSRNSFSPAIIEHLVLVIAKFWRILFGAKREGVARETRATGVEAGRTGDQARPEIQTARHSAIAGEAIERIAALYIIESEVRGKPPDPRSELRQSRS